MYVHKGPNARIAAVVDTQRSTAGQSAGQFASACGVPAGRLSQELVDSQGISLADAVATLRQYLPANAILVGQNVGKDVEWLKLREGADFKVRRATRFSTGLVCCFLVGADQQGHPHSHV